MNKLTFEDRIKELAGDSNENKMYTVIFNNGKSINIYADKVEIERSAGFVKFFHGENYVAQFHLNSVTGWVNANYFIEMTYKVIK